MFNQSVCFDSRKSTLKIIIIIIITKKLELKWWHWARMKGHRFYGYVIHLAHALVNKWFQIFCWSLVVQTPERWMLTKEEDGYMSCVYPVTGCWCDGVHKQPGHRHWQAELKDQHRGVVCLCAVQQDVGGFLTDHSSVASRAVVCWGSIISWWHQQTE